MSYATKTIDFNQYVHGDLCKHLGIDSSTDLDDRYSNLFLNAYINRRSVLESIPKCLHKSPRTY